MAEDLVVLSCCYKDVSLDDTSVTEWRSVNQCADPSPLSGFTR